MGDISEIRGLLVVGTFLAVSVLLIVWIPSDFYAAAKQRTIEPPDYFEASDVVHMNYTYMINITSNDFSDWWGKQEFGHDMYFRAYKVGSKYYMWNEHGYTFFGVYTGGHKQDWINDEGLPSHNQYHELSEDAIEEDWDDEKNLASYTVKCKHFYMKADIAYNTTLYSNVHDAWAAHDLHLLFGIDWDQRGTTWDAWSLIAGVLFFKLPAINVYVNALIAIPLWIAVGYIAFILVLRTLGALFGGGA